MPRIPRELALLATSGLNGNKWASVQCSPVPVRRKGMTSKSNAARRKGMSRELKLLASSALDGTKWTVAPKSSPRARLSSARDDALPPVESPDSEPRIKRVRSVEQVALPDDAQEPADQVLPDVQDDVAAVVQQEVADQDLPTVVQHDAASTAFARQVGQTYIRMQELVHLLPTSQKLFDTLTRSNYELVAKWLVRARQSIVFLGQLIDSVDDCIVPITNEPVVFDEALSAHQTLGPLCRFVAELSQLCISIVDALMFENQEFFVFFVHPDATDYTEQQRDDWTVTGFQALCAYHPILDDRVLNNLPSGADVRFHFANSCDFDILPTEIHFKIIGMLDMKSRRHFALTSMDNCQKVAATWTHMTLPACMPVHRHCMSLPTNRFYSHVRHVTLRNTDRPIDKYVHSLLVDDLQTNGISLTVDGLAAFHGYSVPDDSGDKITCTDLHIVCNQRPCASFVTPDLTRLVKFKNNAMVTVDTRVKGKRRVVTANICVYNAAGEEGKSAIIINDVNDVFDSVIHAPLLSAAVGIHRVVCDTKATASVMLDMLASNNMLLERRDGKLLGEWLFFDQKFVPDVDGIDCVQLCPLHNKDQEEDHEFHLTSAQTDFMVRGCHTGADSTGWQEAWFSVLNVPEMMEEYD